MYIYAHTEWLDGDQVWLRLVCVVSGRRTGYCRDVFVYCIHTYLYLVPDIGFEEARVARLMDKKGQMEEPFPPPARPMALTQKRAQPNPQDSPTDTIFIGSFPFHWPPEALV